MNFFIKLKVYNVGSKAGREVGNDVGSSYEIRYILEVKREWQEVIWEVRRGREVGNNVESKVGSK